MRSIVRVLTDVHSVNSFQEASEIRLIRGNSYTLYFRLKMEKYNQDGEMVSERYIPAAGARVETVFTHLDRDYTIRRAASQAFPEDSSMWSVPILPQDQLAFNSMQVRIFENGVEKNFIVETDIATEETGDRKRFT